MAVVYLARQVEAEQLSDELLADGAASSMVVQADVSQPEPIAALVQTVGATWGRLDVLVNNAAFNQVVPFADLDGLTLELWETILRMNTTGPFLCAQAVAPVMRRQGRGRIVNVGSIAGFQPSGRRSHGVCPTIGSPRQ